MQLCLKERFVSFCYFVCLGVDGFSHPPPALPTDTNFDSLFKQFTSFIFGPQEDSGQVSTSDIQASSGYQACFQVSSFFNDLLNIGLVCSFSADGLCFQYGDVMVTAGERGQRGVFWLPTAGVTADCVDTSPAGNRYS